MSDFFDGLEGVIAATTVLSEVDGEAGQLILRGRFVEDLAGWRFEEALALLWDGWIAEPAGGWTPALAAARAAAFETMAPIDAALTALPPVEIARALLARIADGDDAATALRLVGGFAVFLAAAVRASRGELPLAPDPQLGHAADLLRMLRGAPASAGEVAALDAYLVTVIDHGLNASTFAARVAASTRAGLVSSTLAGLSALMGPLHGGAPGPVLDMLEAIGEPANARVWLEAALDRGERLMGFGHRVYRVRDPRADALKRAVRALSSVAGGAAGRLALVEAVERAAIAVLAERKPGRRLDANVELYTAILLEALAIPPAAFTGLFAAARVAGWVAHAREQASTGRLIRPLSRYVGPIPSSPETRSVA